jgi:hypothetical protein
MAGQLGGEAFYGFDGSLHISDSTISGNTTESGGGYVRPAGVGCDAGAFELAAFMPLPTPSYSPTPTHTPTTPPETATTVPTSTPTSRPCGGDCDGSHEVTVDEVVNMVNIALGIADLSTCTPGDLNDDTQILIDEIVAAVNNALSGCSP